MFEKQLIIFLFIYHYAICRNKGIYGGYQLEKAIDEENQKGFKYCSLDLEPNGIKDEISFKITIANYMTGIFYRFGDQSYDRYKVKNIKRTQMKVTDEEEMDEKYIFNAIENLKKIITPERSRYIILESFNTTLYFVKVYK